MAKLHINGKSVEIGEPVSLKDYLLKNGVNPNVVACELNLKVIKRKDLGDVILKEGDELEIIQMIGGG